MFESKADAFNIVTRRLSSAIHCKELAAACGRQGLKFGFYYSQDQDWTAPGGAALHGKHWDPAQDGDFAKYLETKAIPQLEELLTNYQPYPAVIWFDTPTNDMTPELASKIVKLLNQHPNLIWNNRLAGAIPAIRKLPNNISRPKVIRARIGKRV